MATLDIVNLKLDAAGDLATQDLVQDFTVYEHTPLSALRASIVSAPTFDDHLGGLGMDGLRAFEGFTPYVGTELLTNGNFETDLTGWTQANGAWTRTTAQKKFGVASAETSTAGGVLRQAVALQVGATYALTGWARTKGASGSGGSSIRFRKADLTLPGGESEATTPVVIGAEWQYLVAIWTATEANPYVELRTGSSLTGPVQFDGISLVKITEADGSSALLFDLPTATGWTGEAGVSAIVRTLDSPHGGAIQFTHTAANRALRSPTFSPQDLSLYRYMAVWTRSTLTTGTYGANIVPPTGSTSSPSGLVTNPTIQNTWFLQVYDLSSAGTRAEMTRIDFYAGALDGTTAIGRITFHVADPRVGQGHSLLSRMEDTSLVGYWSLNETAGNVGAELLTNGGFESYTLSPGVPDGWTNESGLATQNARETVIKRTGNNALRITVDGTAGAGSAGVKRNLTVTAGKSYLARVWVRGDGTLGRGKFCVRNETDSLNMGPVGGFVEGTTSATWQMLEMSFTAVAGKTYSIRCLDRSSNVGSICYFDDASLIEIRAEDRSGSGNHAILSGSTMAGPSLSAAAHKTGFGTSYSFDGVDDHLQMPDTLDIGTAMTWLAWVNPTTLNHAGGGNLPRVFDKTSHHLLVSDQGAARFTLRIGGVDYILNSANGVVPLGAWTQLAGTWDGVTQRLYVNGALVASQAAAGTHDDTGILRIGHSVTSARGWAGLIDEIRVYTRALGPHEIAQLYNDTGPRMGMVSVPSAVVVMEQSTDKKEGTYAMKFVTGASPDNLVTVTFPTPVDLSRYRYLYLWGKRVGNTSIGVSLFTQSGISIGLTTIGDPSNFVLPGGLNAWGRAACALPTGNANLKAVKSIRITCTSDTLFLDAIKLVDWLENADWRFVSDNTVGHFLSNAAANSTTSPANGDYLERLDVPVLANNGFSAHVYASGNGTARTVNVTVLGNAMQAKTAPAALLSAQGDADVLTLADQVGSGNRTIKYATAGAYELRLGTVVRFTKVGVNPQTVTDGVYVPTMEPGGANFGPRAAAGKVGNALLFDGRKHLLLPTIPVTDWPGATLECWVYPTEFAGSFCSVFGAVTDTLTIFYRVANQRFDFKTNGSNALAGPVYTTKNAWLHIVATYDGTTMALYFNGALVASTSSLVVPGPLNASLTMGIGAQNNGTEPWHGLLDEPRIYKRALTAAEVLARYNATVGGVHPLEDSQDVYTSHVEQAVVSQDFVPIVGQQAIRQHLHCRVQSVLGERILHPTYGLDFPALETAFDENLLRGELARTILEDPDVEEITEVETSFDGRVRSASYSSEVRLKGDEQIGIEGDL